MNVHQRLTSDRAARQGSPRRRPPLSGTIGAVVLGAIVLLALVGPLIAPYPLGETVGIPGAGPSANDWLGTDFLGRDVLSRVLHGGLPVLLQATASVMATCVIGVTVGMFAGLSRPWVDGVVMRLVDVLIVFPPMLLLLVLIAGAGSGTWALVLGVTPVLFPGLARIVRSATMQVASKSFVEAAVARGESLSAIMRREILPNVLPAVVADVGVRFLWAIFLVASLNFLGLGAQPPAANWGLMVAENRQIASLNAWAIAAPALLIALLSISVNLVGDAFLRSRDGGVKHR